MGATAAQVAVAWVMSRPSLASPIASATSLAQLDDLARAARLTLDAQVLALLDEASRP
jgi:aryl-alcohol dehydrogenase-like predicted oxidoreductase